MKIRFRDNAGNLDPDEDEVLELRAVFKEGKKTYNLYAIYKECDYADEKEDSFLYTLNNNNTVLIRDEWFLEREMSKKQG
jgi:hypothetical protein